MRLSDPMYCTYCGSKKHTLKNCPKTNPGQANRRNMFCTYCGSKKHNLQACPKTNDGQAARRNREEDYEDNYIKD